MRGAAMSLTAAVGGSIVLLLTVTVVQGQNGWGVTYTSTEICALKGSTVEMSCTYTYPTTKYGPVQDKFWFTKASNDVYVDLRTDSEYSGRVQYNCANNKCTLKITDLRESDSAEYKFRFITNISTGRYSGSPGVTLSVTDLQVQVNTPEERNRRAELTCQSSCRLPGHHPHYVWYKNEERIQGQTANSYSVYFDPANSYSCAVEGYEKSRSAPVSVKDHWDVTYTSPQICAFKQSTVNISCTYRYPTSSVQKVEKRFWFTKVSNTDYVDLETDPEYLHRVRYFCDNNKCTLRITDLTESDSAEYKFRFITNHPTGKYSGSPGVTLSVTDPQLHVHVRRSSVNQYVNWTELTCYNTCQLPDHSSYIWYNNGQKLEEKENRKKIEKYFHPNPINPADRYYCAVSGFESFTSPPVYAPKLPSLSVRPSGEIVENSSVTLTCSSDANPAANYTWYKENGDPVSKEAEHVFRSIQTSDSGEYYCTAVNELGRTSESISIHVKYAPKLPSVSVSPSGEIVENCSVTLNCSSDANPAAKYTWYKKNGDPVSKEAELVFRSIQSSDSGEYYCTAENELRRRTSESISIHVKYAPRLPSVSVSPSGEIVEGSSVNLTCSSDANPAAKYTWYKENEDSPKASGQIFTITDFRLEHRGNYYCEAQNGRGRHNSTLHLIVVAGSVKSVAVGSITAVVLAIIFLCAFLLIRKKFLKQTTVRPDNNAQLNMGTVSDNHSAAVQRTPAEQQDDLCYASVSYSKQQEEPLYSNVRPVQPNRHKNEEQEEEDEDSVEYSVINLKTGSASSESRRQDVVQDPSAVYSMVTRTPRV